jgi:hypothetical protein
VRLDGRREGIEPVRRADEVLEGLSERNVLDTERDDRDALVDGAFDLALDLGRLVGARGKDEHHDAAASDRVDDRRAPVESRQDVAWSDPAAQAVPFEGRADGVRDGLVARRVADEDFVRHAALDPLAGWPDLTSGPRGGE